jgi:hypothetical protein
MTRLRRRVQPILALERSDKSPCEICGYATLRSEEGGVVMRGYENGYDNRRVEKITW